jgi:hypothetical protein
MNVPAPPARKSAVSRPARPPARPAPDGVGYFQPGKENTMRDLGWLAVAIIAGVLAVVGWIARERWIMRRRRR